jgi:hypothetical protein
MQGARAFALMIPQASANAKTLLPHVEWCESALEAAQGADVTVVLTEWNEFRAIDLKRLREVMFGNAFVDLRDVYSEALAEEADFAYRGIWLQAAFSVSRRHDKRDNGEIPTKFYSSPQNKSGDSRRSNEGLRVRRCVR